MQTNFVCILILFADRVCDFIPVKMSSNFQWNGPYRMQDLLLFPAFMVLNNAIRKLLQTDALPLVFISSDPSNLIFRWI